MTCIRPSSSKAIGDLVISAGMDLFSVGSTGSGTDDMFCFVTLGSGTAVEDAGNILTDGASPMIFSAGRFIGWPVTEMINKGPSLEEFM